MADQELHNCVLLHYRIPEPFGGQQKGSAEVYITTIWASRYEEVYTYKRWGSCKTIKIAWTKMFIPF